MNLNFRPIIPALLSASSRGLAFSHDGRFFWTDKGALCLTDIDTERTQRLPIMFAPPDFVAMTRDGQRIILLSTEVAIFDIRRSSLRKLGVELSPEWLSPRAQLTPDEKILCISRRNMPPARINLEEESLESFQAAGEQEICELAVTEDGRYLIGYHECDIERWEISTLRSIFRERGDFWHAVALPNDRLFVAGDTDALWLFHGAEKEVLWTRPAQHAGPTTSALMSDGRIVVADLTSVMAYDPMTGTRTPQTPALVSWNDDPHVYDIGRVLPWRNGVVGIVARDAVTFVDVSSGLSIGRFVADAEIFLASISPNGSALHVHTTQHRSHLVRIEMS